MLPAASLTISSILSTPFLLNVPVYQRPFSWGGDQAEQLFDDLLEAMTLDAESSTDPGYFIGTILLMDGSGLELKRITSKIPTREFDIVDGQQRLVSLMTLFAVLRDFETNPRRPLARRAQSMLVAQMGSRFFRTERYRLHAQGQDREILEEYILKVGGTQSNPILTDLVSNPSTLLAVRDKLKALVSGLAEDERERLFAYAADKVHVVIIASSDIDRAHRLFIVLNERGKKLQRNDILKADVLSRMPEVDVEWASQKWDEVGQMLGPDFEHFFTHVRAIYGNTRPQIVSGVRAVVRQAGGAEAFFKSVFVPLAQSYAVIRQRRTIAITPAIARHLHYLNRMADGDWAPAAMLVMRDLERDPIRVAALLGEIERFALLMRLLCAGTGKRVRRFSDIIAALRSDTNVNASHPVFQLTREETRSIAFHLKDLHKRNPKACKLLLLRLSDEISGDISNVNPDDYTIEHVLPQRPSATSEWRRWFPVSEERLRATESLGNLVLITQQQNDRARNASWSSKKDIYAAANVRAPLLAITDDVLDTAEWRSQDVDAREQKLIGMIDRLWRTDFTALRKSVGRLEDVDTSPPSLPSDRSISH